MIDPAAAVTRLVDKLEQAGLVRRERVGTDRRQVLVHITPSGLDKLAELDPLVTAVDAGVTAALSDAELQEFNRLLGLVRGAIAQREKGRKGEGEKV
jgi:DNA-binding MarR family transcriptional regulator